MESSSTIATGTTVTLNKQRAIVGGGLADYFAILGIGDNITFKAAPKSSHGVAVDDEKLEKYLEEEECVMVERFYREIVDIALITVVEEIEVKEKTATRDSSFSFEDDNTLPQSYDNADNRGIYKLNLNKSFSIKRTISSVDHINPAPPLLKGNNGYDKNKHQEGNTVMVIRGAGLTFKTQYLPKEIAGYHMIWRTKPLSDHCHEVSLSDHVRDTSDSLLSNASHLQTMEHGKLSDPNMYPYPFSPKKTRSKLLSDEFSRDGSFARSSNTNHDMDTLTCREFDMSMDSSILRSAFSVKGETYDSDLNPLTGLIASFKKTQCNMATTVPTTSDLSFDDPTPKMHNSVSGSKTKTGISSLVDKMKFKSRPSRITEKHSTNDQVERKYPRKYYVGFRRRGADENARPAIADALLMYVKVHSSTLPREGPNSSSDDSIVPTVDRDIECSNTMDGTPSKTEKRPVALLTRSIIHGAGVATRVALSGANKLLGTPTKISASEHNEAEHFTFSSDLLYEDLSGTIDESDDAEMVPLSDLLPLPENFDEWVIPNVVEIIKLPSLRKSHISPSGDKVISANFHKRGRKVVIVPNVSDSMLDDSIEACVDTGASSPTASTPNGRQTLFVSESNTSSPSKQELFPDMPMVNDVEYDSLLPVLLKFDQLPLNGSSSDGRYEYFPVVALRRQRCGDDERFHEDSAVTDLSLSFMDQWGNFILPEETDDGEDDDENEDSFQDYLKMTPWSTKRLQQRKVSTDKLLRNTVETIVIVRKNVPMGFADIPLVTSVLDRFPRKDYKGLPLPAEELPMFCYPRRGCHLLRAKGVDCPQPLTYGFVVKNERGDSIFVSCISFMEPMTKAKLNSLDRISQRRRKTSVAHRLFCEHHQLSNENHIDRKSNLEGPSIIDSILTGFDQVITYECKTVCLTSRYPFWTAFRRFLAHLHLLSVSSSDIPIERYISHLLLTVPIPKPGGQCILVPLPALSGPMVLTMPPMKDLPLLDLSFRALFSCLDVPTVVTIVIGLLALERKVILMSTYPALVLDVCELLRSLLFPFELCAPYVPRLTQPFMSCLEFPGSIFVGIHDDESPDGLASIIRKNIPDDTIIVDLDTGDIDCKDDRFNALSSCWDIIPVEQRTFLVSELEMLCRDAGIIPGQEALGQELETSFETTMPGILNDDHIESLDDRAVRDCFLRFFCSILGGYDRYLVVPDMDYLISGTDWFDSDGFLATASLSSKDYLRSFVVTQMFQAFIQRRTESSDIRCLLFDECISEFHSAKAYYGRLSKEVTYTNSYDRATPVYNLLIDQCSAEASELTVQESEDGSNGEISFLTSYTEDIMINNTGDLVTAPSRKHLSMGHRYFYCIDGHPSFPQNLESSLFYPKEPDRLCADIGQTNVPILTRSERELDESKRRRRHVISYRNSGQKQRRCLLQFPKLMGSHFLCCWLMCIPQQISQAKLSGEEQTNYLLRALGAVRLLRSRQRITPDEAGYRSLIIACGRSRGDRRLEVVKLFGLLRSDGNFPSAVTLGQYTRAIAEGFSKRSSVKPGNPTTESLSTILADVSGDTEKDTFVNKNRKNMINLLDGNILELEQSGRSWRYESVGFKDVQDTSMELNESKQDHNVQTGVKQRLYTKRGHHKSWFPVTCSSSFLPQWDALPIGNNQGYLSDFKFVALWSRATKCEKCSYILLDEEIQSGWQFQDDDAEPIDTVECPICFHRVYPLLGYKEMLFDSKTRELQDITIRDEEGPMPPQLKNSISSYEDIDHAVGFVSYTSPSKLRFKLEKYVEEYGEDVLERERLRRLDPTVFYNFWWYCGRFSLPLPLAIDQNLNASDEYDDGKNVFFNCCAMASWDKSVAEEGCRSAALCIMQLLGRVNMTASSKDNENGKNQISVQPEDSLLSDLLISDDFPLLANFSLQTYTQSDWDHPDLSEILFRLVEACDKRDLLPVVECVLQRNLDREERFGSGSNSCIVLDCYKTLLYLTRYQCTSAFHRFFLPVVKPCKGWHFWCPNGTVSIFDRMFRDAVDRLRLGGNLHAKIHEPSDYALGFRSVFGHII